MADDWRTGDANHHHQPPRNVASKRHWSLFLPSQRQTNTMPDHDFCFDTMLSKDNAQHNTRCNLQNPQQVQEKPRSQALSPKPPTPSKVSLKFFTNFKHYRETNKTCPKLLGHRQAWISPDSEPVWLHYTTQKYIHKKREKMMATKIFWVLLKSIQQDAKNNKENHTPQHTIYMENPENLLGKPMVKNSHTKLTNFSLTEKT